MSSTSEPSWMRRVVDAGPCPQCTAVAGDACREPRGAKKLRPHSARMKANGLSWRQIDAEEGAARQRRNIVSALERNLRCGKPDLEVEAARLLLEMSAGVTINEVKKRVADLEQRLTH